MPSQIARTKAVNYHQDKILEKILDYVKLTGGELPFDSVEGLCSGLVEYWLYCKRGAIESEYMDDLNYILCWTPNDFADLGLAQDAIFERFINNITALHFDHKLRVGENVRQRQLEKSIVFLGEDTEPVRADELTFVFNKEKLGRLINDFAFAGKMIRIENGFHAVGLMYDNGHYALLNTENSEGPRTYLLASKVSEVIFDELANATNSTSHIALNFRTFDLNDKEVNFPTVTEYAKELLVDPKYKHAVLNNPNIFHLAARMRDYELMDLLFAEGYEHIPWELDPHPEINEAVIEGNSDLLSYLFEHDISPNYQNKYGVTPLGDAISNQNMEMLFALLENGADPNADVRENISSLKFALAANSPESIVLLLAFELDADDSDLSILYQKFTGKEIEAIKELAVKFNTKILGVTNNLDLDTASNPQLIAYLHHLKMQIRLKQGPNNDQLSSILKQIEARYYKMSTDKLQTFSERFELYNLLRYFKIKGFQTKGARHLINSLVEVTKRIVSNPYAQYSINDQQNIANILKLIDDILSFKSSVRVNFYIQHKIYQAKRMIEKHIAAHHTLQSLQLPRKHLLFGSNNCELASLVAFDKDIKPELNLRLNKQ